MDYENANEVEYSKIADSYHEEREQETDALEDRYYSKPELNDYWDVE